jgi:hypothetical protein
MQSGSSLDQLLDVLRFHLNDSPMNRVSFMDSASFISERVRFWLLRPKGADFPSSNLGVRMDFRVLRIISVSRA